MLPELCVACTCPAAGSTCSQLRLRTTLTGFNVTFELLSALQTAACSFPSVIYKSLQMAPIRTGAYFPRRTQSVESKHQATETAVSRLFTVSSRPRGVRCALIGEPSTCAQTVVARSGVCRYLDVKNTVRRYGISTARRIALNEGGDGVRGNCFR